VGLNAFRLLNGIGQNDYYLLVKDVKVVQTNEYLHFVPRNLKSVIK